MAKVLIVFSTLLIVTITMSGCLSTTAKEILPPPRKSTASSEVEQKAPPVGQVVPVFFIEDGMTIDGDFSEWKGLVSAEPYVMVYGGSYDPIDASGTFTLVTDGSTLYVLCDIADDEANENPLNPSIAWRNDSVEIFFGTNTTSHTTYNLSDSHMRFVPVTRDDETVFSFSINDIEATKDADARVVYTDYGYRIEASIGLAYLGIDSLREGQSVRVEFQINDGDMTERDRLIHWMSEHDDPWYDPSVWADGKVIRPESAN